MKIYEVRLPVTGFVTVSDVEADSEKEAIEAACVIVHDEGLLDFDFDFAEKIKNWSGKAEVECTDEGDEDEESDDEE